MTIPPPSLTLDAARDLLLQRLTPLGAEIVALGDLHGRVLAAPACAVHDLPPFDNSAMDGYAVRAADAGIAVPVVARISAGDDPPPLAPGTAAGIATGAVLPDGADAVVPVERSLEEAGAVRFEGPVQAEDHIRRQGADVRAGDVLLGAGSRVSALALSGLATSGLVEARCVRRPRIVLLVTGDELVPPGTPLERGQIHESNSLLIAARCRQLGLEVVATEQVPDTLEETTALFAGALARADIVVSSGGVSMGPRDHVKPALAALGVEQLFWRVAVQPGRPVWAGLRGRTLVIGLPGNPLSVLVGLELLLRPAANLLAGLEHPLPSTLELELAAPLRRDRERTRVLPVRIAGRRAEPLRAEASHQVARAAAADGLVIVSPGEGELPAGSIVEVVPISPAT